MMLPCLIDQGREWNLLSFCEGGYRFEQALDTGLGAARVTKNRCACNQHPAPASTARGNGLGLNSAIHLQFPFGVPVVQHLPHLPDLFQGGPDELLASKPGIDGHDQNQIECLEDLRQGCRQAWTD